VATLRRALGLPGLTVYGVGIIVGAAMYSVIGAAAGLVGDALWLSFVLAATVALLTGLSYAELAAA
jgi:basic amino acid/polyamine antiporter, APA family